MRSKGKNQKTTPIRAALAEQSYLRPLVQDGLGAMKGEHRKYIHEAVRPNFDDSLDLDNATRAGRENEHRWDYLLGHRSSGAVVGLEPHSAKEDEVSTVIAKRRKSLDHIQSHMKPNARVERWLWVASGKVHFADTEKTRIRLDQHGIRFVGTTVLAKHLPD